MRDTGLADRIRAMGVTVVEVDGWRDRGSSDFNPGGAVWHHTAGPSSGATPSLNVCINGRPDLAGPLCNVMQSREPNGQDKAYVIAAGRANHAGSGGWAGLSGNSSVYGLEVEHTGVEPLLPGTRKDIAIRIVAAMVQGRADQSKCCQHSEWTSRKIDIANDTDPHWYRHQCGLYLTGTGTGTPPTTDGEFTVDAEAAKRFDKLEQQIASVGTALNKHIEQEEATQSKVGSVGTALNKHIEQLSDVEAHIIDAVQ
jgi:hypothetical protein